MEKAGVILGRVAQVNPAKVGLGLMVLVEVEALDHTPEWRARFLATVEALPQVMEVLRLGGGRRITCCGCWCPTRKALTRSISNWSRGSRCGQ